MATYKIVGSCIVCGHEPGSVVKSDDLTGANVDHLLEAGHIAPVSTKAAPADTAPTTQED